MKQELEDKLVSIAPYMFRYEGWDNQMESLIGFGFEIGDGWYDLLEALIRGISIIDTEKKVKVVQVKEKFGTLRFYTGGYFTDAIDELIRLAENKSGETCEICGRPAKTESDNHWLSTICEGCREDDGK